MNLQCSQQSTLHVYRLTFYLDSGIILTLPTLQLAFLCSSGVAPDVILASCVQLQYHVKLNRFLFFPVECGKNDTSCHPSIPRATPATTRNQTKQHIQLFAWSRLRLYRFSMARDRLVSMQTTRTIQKKMEW
jgi:hypothetical protein